MKSDNTYLKTILEKVGGDVHGKRKSNNRYLREISENIVDDTHLTEKIEELIQEYGVEEIMKALDQQGYTKNVRLEGDELIFE